MEGKRLKFLDKRLQKQLRLQKQQSLVFSKEIKTPLTPLRHLSIEEFWNIRCILFDVCFFFMLVSADN